MPDPLAVEYCPLCGSSLESLDSVAACRVCPRCGDGVDESIGDRRHPKFDRLYVEGAHDNAIYGSAPGSNGNGQRGTVHTHNCYGTDYWVTSGVRIIQVLSV